MNPFITPTNLDAALDIVTNVKTSVWSLTEILHADRQDREHPLMTYMYRPTILERTFHPHVTFRPVWSPRTSKWDKRTSHHF